MLKTRIMGIINVTPDSFSDAGEHFTPQSALAAIARMIEEGAVVIDIGAESTRPGAVPLSPDEEWLRLEPVVSQLSRFMGKASFSIDTRHPATARKALGLGAHWINDVSGFGGADMVKAVRASECRLVLMHSLTVPADKAVVLPEGADVVAELLEFAQNRIAMLEAAGINRARIIFDPGIGFGKTAAQSLDILRNIKRFQALGVPLLVGHSRKSFLSQYATGVSGRDAVTLAVSQYLAGEGVEYLRVHDVAAHRQMLAILDGLQK